MSSVNIYYISFVAGLVHAYRKQNLMLTPSYQEYTLILTNGSSSGKWWWGHHQVVGRLPREEVAFCFLFCGAQAPLHFDILTLHALTLTLNTLTHACFLCSGSGKHGKRNSLIVVRLGHPLRCLAMALCGSKAAKRLWKHSAQQCLAAKINKSSNLSNLWSVLIWVTMMNLLWQQQRRTNKQSYQK